MSVEKDLRIGDVYRLRHTRKGEFVAQLIRFEKGDDVDPTIMVVKYDVRYGTDQTHMQSGPGRKQRVRVSGIRPSLITSVEATKEQRWLRKVEVPEEDKPKGILSRILGR